MENINFCEKCLSKYVGDKCPRCEKLKKKPAVETKKVAGKK